MNDTKENKQQLSNGKQQLSDGSAGKDLVTAEISVSTYIIAKV